MGDLGALPAPVANRGCAPLPPVEEDRSRNCGVCEPGRVDHGWHLAGPVPRPSVASVALIELGSCADAPLSRQVWSVVTGSDCVSAPHASSVRTNYGCPMLPDPGGS